LNIGFFAPSSLPHLFIRYFSFAVIDVFFMIMGKCTERYPRISSASFKLEVPVRESPIPKTFCLPICTKISIPGNNRAQDIKWGLLLHTAIFAPVNLVSKVLQQAVDEFAQLPGVGHRTAFRFVLHLLKKDPEELRKFGNTFLQLQQQVQYCRHCFNITDRDECDICADPNRDSATICIVEDIRDVVSIENTGQFKGLYHVLGGIISPLDGVGPSDLNIQPLLERIEKGNTKELIFALSTTMEGDTTNFYLFRQVRPHDVNVSTLARGVSVGGGLEFTDELTLGRSLVNRVPYENTLAG